MVRLPKRIIGAKAYDSDPLDRELGAIGLELIAPHKVNKKGLKPKMDGRLGNIATVGKSSGLLLGLKTSGVWLSGPSSTLRTSSACLS